MAVIQNNNVDDIQVGYGIEKKIEFEDSIFHAIVYGEKVECGDISVFADKELVLYDVEEMVMKILPIRRSGSYKVALFASLNDF